MGRPWLTGTLVVSTLLTTGCEREPVSRVDPRLVEALGLRGDEVVHTISLGGRGAEEHIVPPALEIEAGEIVEFVTVDRRIHTVRFVEDSLPPQAVEFLRTTRQSASPPLLRMGSRYVITFERAPPGRYPFVSGGHGKEARGVIVVRSDLADRRDSR